MGYTEKVGGWSSIEASRSREQTSGPPSQTTARLQQAWILEVGFRAALHTETRRRDMRWWRSIT